MTNFPLSVLNNVKNMDLLNGLFGVGGLDVRAVNVIFNAGGAIQGWTSDTGDSFTCANDANDFISIFPQPEFSGEVTALAIMYVGSGVPLFPVVTKNEQDEIKIKFIKGDGTQAALSTITANTRCCVVIFCKGDN